jgi:microcompartment protein CcmK/EutM
VILGRVVGPLWGARRAESLQGQKLLKVRTPSGAIVVAADGLSAGPGDQVLVAHGSRVRDVTLGSGVAVKDVVVAIVDDAAYA